MLLSRRRALFGLLAAPVIVKAASLMRVRVPPLAINRLPPFIYSEGWTWAERYVQRSMTMKVIASGPDGEDLSMYAPVPMLMDGKPVTVGMLPAGATITGVVTTSWGGNITMRIGHVGRS
jgi:hypothetical protein